MAIATVTNRVAYNGDGTSAVFSFPYRMDSQSHLAVFVFNSSVSLASMIDPQVLNTDYTISGTADSLGIYRSGANVVFNSSPNTQAQIIIFRSSVVTSTFSIPQFGGIPATSLTNELDYLTMLGQRAQDLETRSVRLQDGFFKDNFDPTLPANLGQSAGFGVVINSSATGFTLAQLGSSAYTGILPIQYGGTGTNSSFALGSLVFAGSGGIYGSTQQMYFDTTANTLYIGSGLAASQFIGGNLDITGRQTIGGSLTVGSNITLSALTVSRPLRSTTTGEIGVGSTNMSTEVSGLLATAQGGTGTATGYRQYGLIYASSATQFSDVPSSTSGFVLIANGSSAPSFQNLSATNVTSTRTADYITGQTDRYVFLNSSLFTVTLERPASAGKEITVKRIVLDSTSLGQTQIIAGSGCLLGLVGSTTLDTYGESLDFAFDGTDWQYKRSIPSTWTPWITTYNGFGTVGSSYSEWRRSGDSMDFKVTFQTGVVTTGTSYFTVPTGLTLAPFEPVLGAVSSYIAGYCQPGGTLGERTVGVVRDYAHIYFFNGAVTIACVPSSGSGTFNNNHLIATIGSVKILNWNGV